MTVDATVREWHSEEAWGVLDSAETPGGCWTHFSHVAIDGYRELTPADAVRLDWERAEQDGYAYRAVQVWPHGTEPVANEPVEGIGTAYGSTLTIAYDDSADS